VCQEAQLNIPEHIFIRMGKRVTERQVVISALTDGDIELGTRRSLSRVKYRDGLPVGPFPEPALFSNYDLNHFVGTTGGMKFTDDVSTFYGVINPKRYIEICPARIFDWPMTSFWTPATRP
jgi:hypothetical protein